jgi:hypothetical protein
MCDQAAVVKAADVIAAEVNECRRAADFFYIIQLQMCKQCLTAADVMKLLMLWNF